jgi:pyruvate formate lyase activating enzyme
MGEKGIIFDIQRASMHDGPGIRTTVFFKGCPMSCLWCHNPESIGRAPAFSFKRDKCVRCGACVPICPAHAHIVDNDSHRVLFETCTLCGLCLPVCPSGCLSIVGREYTVQELLGEIVRDRAFFESSGGGLTVSGGEPTAQIDFLCELLQGAKEERIHTCVDTSGAAPETHFEKILPYVDLFLFDFKDSNPQRHQHNTGVSLSLVLSNLKYLDSRDAAIVLRCPIIPGINDTPDHFRAIVDMEATYPNLRKIELLPYHNMGVHKAENIGAQARLRALPTTERETAAEWLSRLSRLGGRRIAVG